MSTDRDTHFQGFAQALYQELSALEGSHETVISEYRNKYDKQEIVTLIAQRAYDLVYQSIEFMRQAPQNWPSMELSGTETWVHFIPDLTTPPPAAPGSAAE